jgi:hypothetical protein
MRAWKRTGGIGLLALCAACSGAWAAGEEATPPATIDLVSLPGSIPTAYPAWLNAVPPLAATTLGEADFQVSAPAAGRTDLLLTVIFDDKDGGFLRVYREDGEVAEMISDNLYEGSGAANQRTILLHNVGTQGPTRLVLQSSGNPLTARRLVWEWPQARAVTATSADALVALRGQTALSDAEISGQPLISPSPRVEIAYTSTPLLSQLVRVASPGIALSVALDKLPLYSRLAGKIEGLAPGQTLECWINGMKIGPIAFEAPSLRDPAWLLPGTAEAAPVLAGWRAGTLYIPAAAWQAGDNRVEFLLPDGTQLSPALKDLVLEMVYAPAAPAPIPASTPAPANP